MAARAGLPRGRHRVRLPLLTALLLSRAVLHAQMPADMPDADAAANAAAAPSGLGFTLSPLYGLNRDTVTLRTPAGPVEQTETRPEYGFFGTLRAPHVRASNFLFYTDPNGADITGNFLFVNAYANETSAWTPNVGAGHLYHRIETGHGNITVDAPMVKLGPLFRIPRIGCTLNPYGGFVWEDIDRPSGSDRNDDFLLGVGVGWNYRMVGAHASYYVQLGGDDRENQDTVRAFVRTALSRRWGWILRFDYMEHTTTDDISLLTGPTLSL